MACVEGLDRVRGPACLSIQVPTGTETLLYYTYFRAWEDGAGRDGEAIPWLGAPLHRWVWGVIGPGAQLGEGRGRDGQGEEPILSLLQGKPTIGCRGRGGLWGSALVHPGGLTNRRLYYDANPRGRGRLWGSALVAPGGRSIEDYEESGNTGYELHDKTARARTH